MCSFLLGTSLHTKPDTMIPKARIIIIYDQKINGEGLQALFSAEAEWEVIDLFENKGGMINGIAQSKPHLVVIENSSVKMNWVPLIQAIKESSPETKIVILTSHKAGKFIQRTFRAGAEGYVLKGSGYAELRMAIKLILAGTYFFSPAIARRIIRKYLKRNNEIIKTTWRSLTPREREILKLLMKGWSNQEISAHLSISINTAIKHRANIMAKLEVHRISDLVGLAKDSASEN